MVVAGGQAGHPVSRHYADLLGLWREGSTHPMLFAREQVERYLEGRLILLPGSQPCGAEAPTTNAHRASASRS